MDQNNQDVNNTPASSAGDTGVPAAPPAAENDVKQTPLSVPSAEGTPSAGAPPAKPHEDTVPYERFSEVNEKLKELQAQLEAAKSQAPEEPEPHYEPRNGQLDFQSLGLAPDPNAAPAQQGPFPYNEQVEEQVRDGIYTRPLATMDPIFREWYRQEKMKENQVRRIPDFQKYEPNFYQIPDEIVYQTQANPEVVRFLIAKHQATLQGRTPPTPPASMQNLPAQNNPAVASPAQPKTMEELKAQWKAEGEREAIAKLRNQSGVTSEPATTVTTAPGDEPELDDYGKQFMKNLGIKEEDMPKVAKRLQGQ